MWKEFKEFAMKGNAIDLAIGIVVGAAFGKIVDSLVADILMPPLGLLLGQIDFSNIFLVLSEGATPAPYVTLDAAKAAGAVTLNVGLFVNVLISFFIIAFAVFMLVKAMNKLRAEPEVEEEPTTKVCPYCLSDVKLEATRCPFCTSELSTPAVS